MENVLARLELLWTKDSAQAPASLRARHAATTRLATLAFLTRPWTSTSNAPATTAILFLRMEKHAQPAALPIAKFVLAVFVQPVLRPLCPKLIPAERFRNAVAQLTSSRSRILKESSRNARAVPTIAILVQTAERVLSARMAFTRQQLRIAQRILRLKFVRLARMDARSVPARHRVRNARIRA